MKICFKCGVKQPITGFYKHPRMKDGHLGKCKTCTKKDVSENYHTKPDYYAEYDRKREATDKRRAQKAMHGKAFRANNKEKVKQYHAKSLAKFSPEQLAARYLMKHAVRTKRIASKPCAICGLTKTEGHHHDYMQPLNVTWLCKKHHSKIHFYLKQPEKHNFDITIL